MHFYQNIFYLKNISSNSGFVSLSGNICLTQLRRRATPAPSRFEAIPVETSSLELTTPYFYPQLYSGYIPNYIPGSSFLLLRFPASLNSSPDNFDPEENWSHGTSSQTLVDVYNVCTYTCIGPNWRVSISICNCLTYILKARIAGFIIPQKFWTFRKFLQKCHKMAQKWPKMTQSGPNMTPNGPKWP